MRVTSTAIAVFIAAGLAACAGQTPPMEPAATNADIAPDLDTEKETETERLNAWFEDKFNESISRSPMSATFLGSRENYDKWDDVSPAARDAELEIQRANIAEMQDLFDPAALTDQGQLSFRLAEYELERDEIANNWRGYTYTFSQMRGAHAGIASFLIGQHKVTSKQDALDYISRLEGIETYLGQHLANAQSSAEKGIRPPLFVYDFVIEGAGNVVTGYPFEGADPDSPSPLYADFTGKVDALVSNGTLTSDEADELKFQARGALLDHVYPTYFNLIQWVYGDKANANSDDGAWKHENGDAYYNDQLKLMTTTDMSSDEIHQLGLAEVARIHGEMRAIMTEVGFEGSLQDFFDFTRSDPKFFKPNTDEGRAEYLAEATAMIDTMREALPSVFNTFPKADMVVKAVEPFREKAAGKAFYQRPAPDGSRPGVYYANLYRMQDMPLYQMEALAYHEGIPGHHMQLAISQELIGIPKFRKYGGYTAYTEGWGLYSEFLPKEMGFYEDPYSDFGRLAMELWRAARLVVDTGLHEKRWTREEAIDYLLENTPNPEGDCRKAIERYIVMPGQATAYKIGMIKILDLREDARARLEDKFDIRDFHDVVLKDGPVPLQILEENVEAWITAQL
ncbi:MAG: DUF885 domain-containing protein [Hyphomonadaceae bacterium]|nr:DUF885 domain-containing protein [Hyphomonadaceae bacterium]